MIRNELYTGYYSFIRGKQIYCASNSERVVLFTSQSPLEGMRGGGWWNLYYSDNTIALKTFSICSTVYSEEQLKLLMINEKQIFFPDFVSA